MYPTVDETSNDDDDCLVSVCIYMCSNAELSERYSLIFRSEKSMYYQREYRRFFFSFFLSLSLSIDSQWPLSMGTVPYAYKHNDKVASFLKMLNILFYAILVTSIRLAPRHHPCATEKVSYVSFLYTKMMDNYIYRLYLDI